MSIPEKPGLPKQVQSLGSGNEVLKIGMIMAQEDHKNWSHKCIAGTFWGSNHFQCHAAIESELCPQAMCFFMGYVFVGRCSCKRHLFRLKYSVLKAPHDAGISKNFLPYMEIRDLE